MTRWLAFVIALSWCAAAASDTPSPHGRQIVVLQGDQRIESDQVWKDGTYQVYGNLVLVSGTLTVQDATLEIMCEHARNRKVTWEGGKLKTERATIGGTKTNGVTRPTVFEIYDGEWLAQDTMVQYSCGILFSYATKGRLDAVGLKAGENPDSVIVCGKAEVKLKDSSFDVALHLPAYTGKEVTLDLPVGVPIDRSFNRDLIPGVEYSLRMQDSVVPTVWFAFFVSVKPEGEITRYNLRDCPNLVPGFTASGLKGDVTLPCSWTGDEWPGQWSAMQTGTEASIGSLRVRTLTDKTVLAGWGVYLQGSETDVALRGSTNLCEVMVEEGRCRILGEKGKHNIWVTCTTLDAQKGARIAIEHANLAYHAPSPHYKQITADGAGSTVSIDDVVFGDHLELIAKDGGLIEVGTWSGNREGVTQKLLGGQVKWPETLLP